MRLLLAFVLILSVGATVSADSPPIGKPLLRDDFSEDKHDLRKATRGQWIVADGMISVTQDDETYKKFKNHGPLLAYGLPLSDVEVRVDFKPDGCRSVVFTFDAESGHAFRIIMTGARPGVVYGYDPQPGEDRPKANPLTRQLPKLSDQWTSLRVRITGDKASIRIGDSEYEVSHPSIGQKKTVAKIGFAFGSFHVRRFELDSI